MNRRQFLGTLGSVAIASSLASPLATFASEPDARLPKWIEDHSVALQTTDPRAELEDLLPLRRSNAAATVVGLGESVHGASEELTLKHRILRLLVEMMGFRSVAWEEDWTNGMQINDYLRSANGNAETLVSQMTPQWHVREVADVLRWLRSFNANRSDKVQFAGLDYYLTPLAAYTRLDDYVAVAAPRMLNEVRAQLEPITPKTSDVFEHISLYMQVADKQPYIQHARELVRLIEQVPHGSNDAAHALMVRTAQLIVLFYVHFSLSDSDALIFRDAHMADNLQWWAEFTGDRIAFWAASAHTANAPGLRIAVPPQPDLRFPSAGSYLRRQYGEQYLSIGFTFDHGAVNIGEGASADMPPAANNWFEFPLGQVDEPQFAVDRRHPAPPPVRNWLSAPLTTRGLGDRGPTSFTDGGTVKEWFDLLIHRQEVSPAHSL
jgi:erythromycin esterase-like protein